MKFIRNVKIPKKYCCPSMKDNLKSKDMVNYIWYTRDYVLVSSESPMIQSFISFCPFCGKHIGSESLHQEYYEACDQAAESDSSFPDFDDDSKMEEFRIEFLIRVESQEKTQNL